MHRCFIRHGAPTVVDYHSKRAGGSLSLGRGGPLPQTARACARRRGVVLVRGSPHGGKDEGEPAPTVLRMRLKTVRKFTNDSRLLDLMVWVAVPKTRSRNAHPLKESTTTRGPSLRRLTYPSWDNATCRALDRQMSTIRTLSIGVIVIR